MPSFLRCSSWSCSCDQAASSAPRAPCVLELFTVYGATINFILINIALALSIYVTLSCGLLSLANAGFMAIGAYTTAVLLTRTGAPLAVSFTVALLLGIALAVPLGAVVLRLRDVYLA